MFWIWGSSDEDAEWGANPDFGATFPFGGGDAWSDKPLDRRKGQPVYRSNDGLKRFRKFHCPPFGSDIVVDKAWQEIILKFVPADRVQFFPVKLIARSEVTEEFSWLLSFDRVNCIDLNRSIITKKFGHDDDISIHHMKKFYYTPNCLHHMHMARDIAKNSMLLISNELKEVLAATGESTMFKHPEDMVDAYRDIV